MRISDWSSDVCSSDLAPQVQKPFAIAELAQHAGGVEVAPFGRAAIDPELLCIDDIGDLAGDLAGDLVLQREQVPEGAVVMLGPQGAAIGGTEQLGGDAHRSDERRGGKGGYSTCRARW